MNRPLRVGASLLMIVAMFSCGDSPTPPPENQIPTLGDLTVTLAEDTSVEVDVLDAASDPDGGTLTVTSFEPPAHGAVSQSGGVLTYTPDADYHGTDQFEVTVTDGEASVTGTVALTITPVNDAPVATDDEATLDEDETVTLDVLANDSDIDRDALEITEAIAVVGAATIADGAIEYVPEPDFSGADTIAYTVTDPAGATATADVALSILPVNDPPTAVADEATGSEDETLQIDVLANDADPEGDPTTIESFAQGAHGTVAADNPGLAYIPTADWHGTDTFVYYVTDGIGGLDSATVTVTIEPVPDKPIAGPDTIQIDENGSEVFDLLANDTDADGDALQIASVGSPAHGTAALEDGQVGYTPEADYSGSDAFDYVVADGTGLSDTATVTVTVANVNDPPIAVDDAVTVNEDESAALDLRGNDSDPDGDSLAIEGWTTPAHGSVSQFGEQMYYNASEANYNGPDSFDYVISDPSGALDTATVSVTVEPVNDLPDPQPDTVTVAEDGTILIDVLANDVDVDGDSLMAGSTTFYPDGIINPAHGTAAWENEQVRYMPHASFSGADSLGYWVTDRAGEPAQVAGMVYITVTPVNDAPVAAFTFAPSEPVAGDVVSFTNASADVDGDVLTYRWDFGALGTSTESDPSRTFPDAGDYPVTLVVDDGFLTDTLTQTVTVAVDPGEIAFHSDRDGNNEIYVMAADGSSPTRLTNSSGHDLQPDWISDGSRIAFLSYRDGNGEIYVMDADGSTPTRLTNNSVYDGMPTWSPDGSKIAFGSDRDGNGEIYVMDADGTNPVNLTNNTAYNGDPDWSPDGTRIAFRSSMDGNYEVHVMDADGSNPIRLTNHSAWDVQPAWSPDGSKIAFGSTRDGNHEIYVMGADGSNLTRLTNNSAYDFTPTWSPDGSKISFISDRDGDYEVYVMDADGSNPIRLTNNTATDDFPAWH